MCCVHRLSPCEETYQNKKAEDPNGFLRIRSMMVETKRIELSTPRLRTWCSPS